MNTIQNFYCALWILYFLQSMRFMYLWFLPGGIIGILITAMSIFNGRELLIMRNGWHYAILIIGFIVFSLNYEFDTFANAINILILPLCVYYLLQTSQFFRILLLERIRDTFFILLVFSLPFFLIYVTTGLCFNLGTIQENIYIGINAIFFFYQPEYNIRFASYFCEPGHLGMILSFILFTQNYDFHNKKNLFLLINLLFTLSLAAYILLFTGYFFSKMNHISFKLNWIFGFLIIIVILYIIFSNSPILNEMILNRLVFDSDQGTISGDNRINWNAAQYFANMNLEELFYGVGTTEMNDLEIRGTGLYIHIIQYGIIGVLSILFYYMLILFKYKKTYLSIGLFFLYIFAFYQRSYALWACELILFVSYVSINEKDDNILYNYT